RGDHGGGGPLRDGRPALRPRARRAGRPRPRPDARDAHRRHGDRGGPVRHGRPAREAHRAGAHAELMAPDRNDRALLRRYHEQGDLRAREELIEQHMALVRSLARRYAYRGEQLDDLVQIGAIGLIKAIDRFDLDRGVELTTYATPNIIGEIKR